MRMDSRPTCPARQERLDGNLPSFILAGIALTGSPGPNTLGLAAASAAYGLRRSDALLVGAIVGVLAVMLATATGLTAWCWRSPGLLPW
jgi:threonine/homoserine/homoserine lactone efflux protein